MSRNEVNIETQLEINRMIQLMMNEYTQQNSNQIKWKGYVDEIKSPENIRILTLNPKGINPQDDYKIEILIEACKKYQVDIMLLNETQVK